MTTTDRSPMVGELAKFTVVERWRRLCTDKGETPESRTFLLASWVESEMARLRNLPAAVEQTSLF